jgi:hypothetical protein
MSEGGPAAAGTGSERLEGNSFTVREAAGKADERPA